MYDRSVASDVRILNVTSLAGVQTMRQLVNTALALKTGAAATLPTSGIAQIAITPAAAVTVGDVITGDGAPVAANTRVVYPLNQAIDRLTLTGAGVVSIEIYFAST
jgi:hypothetical protein